MQTSDPGSSQGNGLAGMACGLAHRSGPGRVRQAGFTLLELLIVIAVIAVASGLTILALRDPAGQQLEQEAARLAALLDAARLESRISGQALTWRPLPAPQAAQTAGPSGGGTTPTPAQSSPSTRSPGFQFDPPMAVMSGATRPGTDAPSVQAWPTQWLHPGVQAEVIGAPRLVLGPEPLIPPQRLRLQLGQQQRVLATDGLGPFRIEEAQ